jgi:asparagine synthase (glutamine-hydrolysing)
VKEIWASADETSVPTAFEIATGIVYGQIPAVQTPSLDAEPRIALEGVIRPFLARVPCTIAFSGGRDSSALLAVAVSLARREGWPEPVPVTLQLTSGKTFERDWQERVVAAVGVSDWMRVPLDDELDLVGPIAAEGLLRHGVRYPANAHTIVPLAERARGGAVLTGVGGDDVFGNWPWHDVASVFAGRRRGRAGDLRRLARWCAPAWLRREILMRREPLMLPWVREPVRRVVAQRLAHEQSSAPRTWASRMRWNARWRAWRTMVRTIGLLGADHGVEVGCPFLEPRYLGALSRAGGHHGWGDRTATMRALFGDLLPDRLLSRSSKAEFSETFFGPHTAAFAERWDGAAGLDPTLVDGHVLKAVWRARQPHFLSAMAVQAAWLASGAAGARARRI